MMEALTAASSPAGISSCWTTVLNQEPSGLRSPDSGGSGTLVAPHSARSGGQLEFPSLAPPVGFGQIATQMLTPKAAVDRGRFVAGGAHGLSPGNGGVIIGTGGTSFFSLNGDDTMRSTTAPKAARLAES